MIGKEGEGSEEGRGGALNNGWWLHYISPDLYTNSSIKSLSQLSDKCAITLLVHLLSSQPEPSWYMLVRVS